MRLRRTTVVASVLALALAGCGTDPDDSDDQDGVPATTRYPADEVTVLTGDGDADLAVAASRTFFESAPVVALADAGDEAARKEAAGVATDLGVPLLLKPGDAGPPEGDDEAGRPEGDEDPDTSEGGEGAGAPDGGDGAGAGLAAELERLSPGTVLTFGSAAERWVQSRDTLVGRGTEATAPSFDPPEPLDSLTVLTADTPEAAAATTTARAAGARVLTTGTTDPRADPAVIEALAGQPPTHTVAIGARFGPTERLRQQLAVAGTGVQLPGGGQRVLPGRRFVALYGHPGDPGLGALGEQPLADTVERAHRVAAEYESLVEEPVIPTFEIITTVASASAGPEGDYSRRTPVEDLRPWVDAAAEAGIYVVLDLQPGHTDFLTQAKEYEELLREPHVGLALDPEWRLAPHQQHMVQIGSVDAAEVNKVADWLADLTAEHRLPQKLLVLHQFTLAMIKDRGSLRTERSELSMMIHADGFGTRGQKLNTWRALRADAPDVWWGWKNFYDEDQPTFTPDETVALEPTPRFISYQ